MTKDQLKSELTDLGVEFAEDAKKDELEALLAEAKGGSEPEGESTVETLEAPAPVPAPAPVAVTPKDAVKEAPKAPSKTAQVINPGRKAHWPADFTPTGDRAADTKRLLDAEPKVMFMCPLAEGEKPGSEEIVQINGHKYTIKKGHMVEVPKSVAAVLANKYKVEMEVAQKAQAYATPERSAALSG